MKEKKYYVIKSRKFVNPKKLLSKFSETAPSSNLLTQQSSENSEIFQKNKTTNAAAIYKKDKKSGQLPTSDSDISFL